MKKNVQLHSNRAGAGMHMEGYDEFCSRSLVRLQTKSEAAACGRSSVQQEALSIIRFHGRAVLAPLLSVDQRREMTQYRQRAAQLEADRLRRANLLARVQDIIDSVQVRKGTGECEGPASPARSPPKSEVMNGFALLPNMSSPPWGARDREARNADPPALRRSLTLPNGMGEGVEGCEEGEGAACGGRSLSLQALLRKSRAYLEREHGRRGAWAGGRGRGAPPQAESLSDKENESSGGEQGTERRSQSPLTPPTRPPPSEPDLSPDSLLERVPRSLTGSYARLPSPEPSLSPRPHRRRPRPFSAGNILISCPMSAAELSPGKGQEGGEPGAWGAAARDAAPERRSPNCRSPADSPPPSAVALRNSGQSGARQLRGLPAPVSTSAPGPAGPDATPPGIRRRSNTLDSSARPAQSGPPLDRSQEGTPRLLGGPAQRAARRRSPPVALNQSYDIESPSPMLQRPHVTSEPAPGFIKHQSELEGSHEGRAVLSPLPVWEQNRASEEVQRRVTALEEARRQMEEEHAQQLSLLIAEQEKEQQHLRQELEERDWALRGQGGDQALSDSLTTAERSPAHSIGCLPVFSPGVPLPAAHSPAYRRGPSWGAGKPRSRLNQVVFPPELQGALCRLSAVARGFLTRRLLKTEKLKHLRQTVLDTRAFIQSFQTEALLKRGSLSAQDVSLQERLRVQVTACIHTLPNCLLQQDRELRTERKLREMNKGRSPRERAVLSAATQRSLDRKKQRVTNTPGQGKRSQQKPKSPPINRVLQPNQGLNAPLPGQPLRHGSLSRKNPEERVKRVDSLKKPNSLG
ncbi:centriolar coiled-coil protein of 110 kDa [Anguilla rostrata]|uniref:centriolar coiled-coil protein of 110 kDa n=1 Tax=Anguilla rostrata TaxID=7938 RepID=UPI0030D21484